MKKLFYLLLLVVTVSHAQQADILIKNGRIIDGTGNSWTVCDVAVKDGKIVAKGHLDNWTATKTIDATGLIVSPGFIDVHTHMEDLEKKDPQANNFIFDGVTTVITGNCGVSHTDIKKYFEYLDNLKMSINIGSLVGHNDVRKACLLYTSPSPRDRQKSRMPSSA